MADEAISSERTPLLGREEEGGSSSEQGCLRRPRLSPETKQVLYRYLFRMALFSIVVLFAVYVVYTTAVPSYGTRHRHNLRLEVYHGDWPMDPVLPVDFPDPALVQDDDGTWYAFSTNSRGKRIPVAKADGSDPFGQWGLLDIDALPTSTWNSGRNDWAPDVKRLDDGSYIMYFSGEVPDSHQHCIGTARSDSIAGPYIPDPEPWVCPREDGGAIDASGFYDYDTDRRYVVYKVDGNSKGDVTPCGTGVDDPELRTPLMLQEVEADGTTKIGGPVEIMDRIASEDGALVEAPELTKRDDGTYVLFFSSHCFQDPKYDIKYAWSEHIEGPYIRGRRPLLKTPDFELDGPGGISTGRTVYGDEIMAFHGYCKERARCLYVSAYGSV